MIMAEMQEDKPIHMSTFQISSSIISANISLANSSLWSSSKEAIGEVHSTHHETKASHIAKPNTNGQEYSSPGENMGIFLTISQSSTGFSLGFATYHLCGLGQVF